MFFHTNFLIIRKEMLAIKERKQLIEINSLLQIDLERLKNQLEFFKNSKKKIIYKTFISEQKREKMRISKNLLRKR